MSNITYIDGNPYSVRLLMVGTRPGVPNEWDSLLDDLGEDDGLLHWNQMFFWGQETDKQFSAYHANRRYYSARYWHITTASYRSVGLGFRPVLEPLDPDTLTSDKDGKVIRLGSLYMDGKALPNPKHPTWNGDIPDYIDGAELRIGDSAQDPDHQIRWIQWRGILVSDRVLLKRVSWNDLNVQGLVFGCEAGDTGRKNGYTDDEIAAAKAILRLIPIAEYVERTYEPGILGVTNRKNGWITDIDGALFPSVGPGKFADLRKICEGAE